MPPSPRLHGLAVCFVLCCTAIAAGRLRAEETPPFSLRPHDRICLIGNALAERMQHDGWLEARIQQRFPDHELVFRNLGYAGDELRTRLRSAGFGSPDDHLRKNRADVIFAFFGYNESFGGADGLAAFRADLDRFIDHTLAQSYNGESAPRLVLFGPPAHENLQDPHLPDGRDNNRRLRMYSDAMRERAKAKGVAFVNLFEPSGALYRNLPDPFTVNGIHFNQRGNRWLAQVILDALLPDTLFPTEAPDAEAGGSAKHNMDAERRLEAIRRAVLDKNFRWFQRYRAVDGYSIYGGRSWLRFDDGKTNREVMQREMEILDRMTANRDARIWSVARGRDVPVRDENLPPFLEVETNKPGSGPGGTHRYLDAERAIDEMRVAEGFRVELFASEKDFPELANPVQMAFDPRGRLWVAVMPSYPHGKPGEVLDDKVLILEDTDRDGRADSCTVFADRLHVPTGLEFYRDGVLVGAQPDLLYLRDTDGDNRADERTRVLHGFDSADTHHALNSFVLDPGGALYFQEGTFHHTQVETPWGPPRRNVNGGVFRYEPRTAKLEVYVAFDFANPHGHVFDRWGQDFITDATGNINYYATPFSGRIPYPAKHAPYFPFFEQRERPTAASEIVSSRHFPAAMQGRYLLANVVGFQGILQYTIRDEGAGFRGVRAEPLVQSADPNFRPVDLEIGPDGALYFLDWQNALIGHMQHHIRDPNRDRTHGRVYRLVHTDRPLSEPARIHGRPIPELLELLKSPEDRLRYRVKIELGGRPTVDVMRALDHWLEQFDEPAPDDELTLSDKLALSDAHHLLEALWLHQYHHVVDQELLARVLHSPEPRARAAATRVLCAWRDELDQPLSMLRERVGDTHPRVRLEAVRACSFFDEPAAAEIALESLRHPTDRFLRYALNETLRGLETIWKPVIEAGQPFASDNPEGIEYVLNRFEMDELLELPPGPAVYLAWLSRAGVPHKHRHAALRELAQLHQTSITVQWLAAIERLDWEKDPSGSEALADLAHMVADQPRDALRESRSRLERLAREARRPMARRIAYLALLATDGSVARVWATAADRPESLRDLLLAVPQIADPALRAACHRRIEAVLEDLGDSPSEGAGEQAQVEVRRAAIGALAATGVRPTESVRMIARLAVRPPLRSSAVQALSRIDLSVWPAETIEPMVESILARLRTLPADQRGEADALEELALANRLAERFTVKESTRVRAALRELGVHVIVIRPRPQQMRYDREQIFVEAGKAVEIVFDNVDIMPHNLVIASPGSLGTVGLAAERMATRPDGFEREFIPDIPEVLLATRLLQPGQTDRLRFVAPRATGEYPYVCTFPGHWRRMHGTMHVVESLEGVPVRALAAAAHSDSTARAFVRQWKVSDLAEQLESRLQGRSWDRGRELFGDLACVQCHRIRGEGGQVGPDLAGVGQKLSKGSTTLEDVLREMIEPSARIDERFRTQVIRDAAGRVHTGIVADRNAKSIRLLPNPLAPTGDGNEPLELPVDQIDEEFPSQISLMPAGLLNTLTRDEILDLLAFVVSNGDPRHAAYSK